MMTTPLDPELLQILICPVSRKPLVQDGDALISTDSETRRRYRIVEGIPDLLIEDSEELSESEWREIINRVK